MNNRQTLYAVLVDIAGAAIFYFAFQNAANVAMVGGFPLVARIVVFALLLALLRSFFDSITARRTNLSYVLAMTIALMHNASLAIVAYEASTLISFSYNERTGNMRSVLSGSMRELLFSDSVVILSVALGENLYRSAGMVITAFQWPASLVPACQFVAATGLISWALLSLMILLGEKSGWRAIFTNLLILIPTVLLGTASAILLTQVVRMPGGDSIAGVFIAALLSARYAYGLYRKNREQYEQIIDTLSEAIEAKDSFAQGHATRVEKCAMIVGRSLHLSKRRLYNLSLAARLHDIGKVGVDDILMRKEESLDENEWLHMRKHPEIGHKIISQIELHNSVANAILHHHERYDGAGYPQGVKMSERPVEESILSAAAAFVAMRSVRPYRSQMSMEDALRVLKEEAGRQFHPAVSKAFLKCEKKLRLA